MTGFMRTGVVRRSLISKVDGRYSYVLLGRGRTGEATFSEIPRVQTISKHANMLDRKDQEIVSIILRRKEK